MNFVVIGGAGFIGSHIVKHLVSRGHSIKIIDNLFRGKIENFNEIKSKIEFVKVDILDFDNLKNELKNTDGIFHQAALTSVPESYDKEEEYKLVNVTGTENIFKVAQENDLKVVFASSSSVYGNTDQIPIKENTDRKPINPYGLTKLQDELLAEKYSKLGTKIIGLRYFNVFGKGQNLDYGGVITKFLENISNDKPPMIFGDGLQSRDFIFVKDVAKANLAAMCSQVDNGFFNIGTGKTITLKELSKLMIKISGKQMEPVFGELHKGDIKSSQADITLSKKHLSWEPETSIEEGLVTLFS